MNSFWKVAQVLGHQDVKVEPDVALDGPQTGRMLADLWCGHMIHNEGKEKTTDTDVAAFRLSAWLLHRP